MSPLLFKFNPFWTKTLLRRFFMYCTINLGPYGDVLTYVLDFLSFHICIRKFCICSFFEHWSNRLLTTCKLSKMYKITFHRNNVIKMVTAIKNRLSRMIYAFIHKTKDLCSAFAFTTQTCSDPS